MALIVYLWHPVYIIRIANCVGSGVIYFIGEHHTHGEFSVALIVYLWHPVYIIRIVWVPG